MLFIIYLDMISKRVTFARLVIAALSSWLDLQIHDFTWQFYFIIFLYLNNKIT